MITVRQFQLLAQLSKRKALTSADFDVAVTPETVYSTLRRIEQQGLVSSKLAQPRRMRGGRARRFFSITKQGRAALRAARKVFK